MEVFKKGKIIDSWGVVYAGIKMQWLSPNAILDYCASGKIKCDEDRLVKLHMAIDQSLFTFLEQIKAFIIEDGDAPIILNEDSLHPNISAIPASYWKFWQLEFLLRVTNAEFDKEEKLHEVAALYRDFGYPESWYNFINYHPTKDNKPIGVDGLYKLLMDYIDKQWNDL